MDTANPSTNKDADKDQRENSTIGEIKPTGIDGLDQILRGGLPSDSTILVAGASGVGKTILAMQWLFKGFHKYNEPGLYLTLTEPVNKAIRNVRKMNFAQKEDISPGRIHVEDLRNVMNSLGIAGKELQYEDVDKIIDAIFELMHQCNAKRIVLDSISAIAFQLGRKELIRTFIYHMDAMLSQTNVNVLMTSEVGGDGFSIHGVEEFISDGIIKLTREKANNEMVNKLQVYKMRGTEYDSHASTYRITDDGIVLYPRLNRELDYKVSTRRVATGVPGLDEMTEGGYFEGSSILVTGSSGTGKTLIASQFIVQGIKDGQKTLYVSYEESRDQIIRNAQTFGWKLEEAEAKGDLKILVAYPEQYFLEEHIDRIRQAIEEFDARLVVIDSLSALGNVYSEEKLRDFVSRLNAYLKGQLVTTILTNASATLMGAEQITDAQLSTISDHIIMLRYVEIQSELRHAILILKMRGSKHDKKLRELAFTSTGLQVTNEFSGFEGVMSGATRRVSESVEEQLHKLFLEILGPMGEKIFHEEQEKGLSSQSVDKLIEGMSKQGVLSESDKQEFTRRSNSILGVNPQNETDGAVAKLTKIFKTNK